MSEPEQQRQFRLSMKRRLPRFIRHIPEYEAFGDWCDRCRMWTTQPEKHRHEDPLY